MNQTKTDLSAFNDRQIDAIINENRRLLVLAGAGSGKTKTLLQKLIYLIEEKGVSPSNILAITFTKNAANEMLDRLIIAEDSTGEFESILFDKRKTRKDKDLARISFSRKYRWIDSLTVKTFHSLCYSILRSYGVNEFDNKFKIIGEDKATDEEDLSSNQAPETVYEVFQKCLIELCNDTEYLINLKRYVLDYVVDKIHLEKARAVLPKEGKYYTTLNGDKVRSKSEQYIADWLFRHSIPYEYEPLLNVKDFEFNPDFHIPDANLYIEHISEKSYSMRNKEEQFQKGNISYVKTYESMANDTAVFNHALDAIVKSRLPQDFNKNRTLVYNEEFNRYHEDVKEFVRQVIRITDMIKVENINTKEVYEKSQKDQHERIRIFYKVVIPLVERYSQYCVNKSYLDFNDLILTTISLFSNQPDILNQFRKTFKYILVDEFQDVNNLQVDMIKQLLQENTQLFCVGDDWQSIYGFRGSNVGYIVEFEKHFENAQTIKLNLNYRSTQNIVEASNEVIKNNKFKVEKDVLASKKSENKIVVFDGKNEQDNIDFCLQTVKELLDSGIKNDEILFLYRRTKMYTPYYNAFKSAGFHVQSKTIHGAKGLESKVVFIIGLTEGNGGFPDIWLEDRIFQVIRKGDHEQLMEEERRLFYVALTRAKDKLYLISEKGNESSFLKEIPDSFTVKTSVPLKLVVDKTPICPSCSSQLEKLFAFCPYCGEKQSL